jgi:hypothetical protein
MISVTVANDGYLEITHSDYYNDCFSLTLTEAKELLEKLTFAIKVREEGKYGLAR